MSNLNTHGVRDYDTALKFLKGRREVTLCYKTTITDEGKCITVRHHDTAIIRYWRPAHRSMIEIRNGGHLSSTTTDRLHRMTPVGVRVWRAKGGGVESPVYSGPQPYDWQRVA